MDKVTTALEALRAEEKTLLGRLSELEKQSDAIAEQVDRVRAGLAGLTGEKKPARGRSKKGNGVDRAELVGYVRSILKSGELTQERLKEAVFRKAKESGKPQSGVAVNLGHIMKDGALVTLENGLVRLV